MYNLPVFSNIKLLQVVTAVSDNVLIHNIFCINCKHFCTGTCQVGTGKSDFTAAPVNLTAQSGE